ncbi:zeta toxin family protein [Clavibacter sp. VKM Ac-2542]|uniref:zeta toxin family protein n=1 Tax=Clavibacter sp. VKM Ac-2542 TaxID=2783811 RepID=UPI00188C2537|nr:zeta toxin family protein [Clavibacter sp. VKM Ac-2542]MBF4621839.1 zeta toxin family protein [Clavibacter sp. VKM Ac-2542]
MSVEEPSEHLATLRQLSVDGGPIAWDAPTATTRNPRWWQGGEPTSNRRRLHERLLREAMDSAANDGAGKRAILLAGPPGAGKSTARASVLGAASREFITIDADEFKTRLLDEAVAEGSYDSWIKPPVVAERETAGERFHPMELSSLVHTESADLADRLRRRALSQGRDVVIDTVLSSDTKARQIMGELERAGYDVQVVDVEVPREVSEERIRQRWQEGNERAERGDGLGGRWVPSEFGAWVYGDPGGRSRPEANARMVAEESPAVSRYRVYRTTAEQAEAKAPPNLETDMSRAMRGGPLVPTRSGSAAEVPRARTVPGITRTGRTTPGRAGPARVDRGR